MTDTTKRFQCRHIFTDGHRCGSPCLRNGNNHHEEFCYYHHTTRHPALNPRSRRTRQTTFDLPLPEDRSAIQSAIGQVLRRIASNDLDPRRAGLLLYGLQIASLNLPRPTREPAPTQEPVTEIITHPTLGILAPPAEIIPTPRPRSPLSKLIEQLANPQPKPQPAPQSQPTVIPTLQATASQPPQKPLQHAFTSTVYAILLSLPLTMSKPIVLTILDGWGYRSETHGNAIALARKPVYDGLLAQYPNTLLHASDHFVGLPDGQMGNSEVGHLNIGAGRVVRMDMTRIDTAITDGSFFTDPTLTRACELAAHKGRSLHLIGLLSDGGVHSHQRHLYALLRLAAQHKLQHVYVHAFMDGRDTLPNNGLGYIEALQQQFREIGVGHLASVSGRYYAMDRDLRWEKEKQAFDALVTGQPQGGTSADPLARIRDYYNNDITDEFIPPFTCTNPQGDPIGLIRDEDVVINFNYRADRVRQITRVLTRNSGLTNDPIGSQGHALPKAAELDAEIPLHTVPTGLHYVCMTQYDKNFKLPVVIPPESMENLLAHLMAQANLRNLRVAETEKYAHVTYFLNGGIEKPFPGEDRVLIPSQKVATYDLAPEMSAAGIADAVIKAVNDTAFDVIIVNFANADMVGHSGKLEPTIRAVETVDRELGRIYNAVRQYGGKLLVTADHGNAEMLIDPINGGPHTSHTTNPVPFIYISDELKTVGLRSGGSLRDISPTMLPLLHLDQPHDMTGHNLRIPPPTQS
jgi:2,3-bisphosphoglycerate-independent phosphoglycerate mutase